MYLHIKWAMQICLLLLRCETVECWTEMLKSWTENDLFYHAFCGGKSLWQKRFLATWNLLADFLAVLLQVWFKSLKTCKIWYSHVCTAAHQHCFSVSSDCSCKPFCPRILYSSYISFPKQNQTSCNQKMCDVGYVHRQKHHSPMNSVCLLLWVQHNVY